MAALGNGAYPVMVRAALAGVGGPLAEVASQALVRQLAASAPPAVLQRPAKRHPGRREQGRRTGMTTRRRGPHKAPCTRSQRQRRRAAIDFPGAAVAAAPPGSPSAHAHTAPALLLLMPGARSAPVQVRMPRRRGGRREWMLQRVKNRS